MVRLEIQSLWPPGPINVYAATNPKSHYEDQYGF